MQRYFDIDAMRSEVTASLEEIFTRHGLENSWQPLAVSLTIDALGSPLKYQLQATPLSVEVGRIGGKLYAAARLVLAVEAAKSPHSQTVNPMMDAIALAVSKSRTPLSDDLLFRNAMRVFFGRPRLSSKAAASGEGQIGPMSSAFKSALVYLETARVVERSPNGLWQLSDAYSESH